jgi:hypothetical protein
MFVIGLRAADLIVYPEVLVEGLMPKSPGKTGVLQVV